MKNEEREITTFPKSNKLENEEKKKFQIVLLQWVISYVFFRLIQEEVQMVHEDERSA
jgi:hypothetical protein